MRLGSTSQVPRGVSKKRYRRPFGEWVLDISEAAIPYIVTGFVLFAVGWLALIAFSMFTSGSDSGSAPQGVEYETSTFTVETQTGPVSCVLVTGDVEALDCVR